MFKPHIWTSNSADEIMRQEQEHEQDVCKLVLYLKNPDDELILTPTRRELKNFCKEILDYPDRPFIHICGHGIPIERITLYQEEDSNGQSVLVDNSSVPGTPYSYPY